MKKLILSIFTVFILSILGNTQPTTPIVYDKDNFLQGIYDVNANFYEVKAAGEEYFAQDSSLRVGNSHGYKDFLRYIQFWEPRSYDDGNLNGDLNKYHELINGYSQNRSVVCNEVPQISNGYNWNFLGPENLPNQFLGMITSVAYYNDNGDHVIFAGSAAGGVFKTVYTGAPNPIWTCITDDLNFPGIGFTDLRVVDDGLNGKYLFAGTGLLHRNYGIGILRYDLENPQNGWTNVTLNNGILNPAGVVEESHVHHIVFDPSNKSILYASIGSRLYKSLNHGTSWTEIFYTGIDAIKISKIIFHPSDANIIYLSSYTTATPSIIPPEIYKSIDAGANWTVFTSPLAPLDDVARIDISTASYLLNIGINEDPIYCAYSKKLIPTDANSFQTYVLRYNDGTSTFDSYCDASSISAYLSRHCFELSPNSSPTNPNFYFGTLGFHKGVNGTMSAIVNDDLFMHDDIRDLELIPNFSGGDDHILIGNDGGVSFSVNSGDNWINLNGPGLNITQFQGIDVSEVNDDVIVGGTQDNNAYKYSRATNSWTKFADGDVYNFQISEKNGDDIYFSKNNSSFTFNESSLYSGGGSQISHTPFTPAAGSPYTLPQFQLPSGIIYFGSKELGIIREDCGNTEPQFVTDLNPNATCINGDIQAIAICESNPEIGYIAFNGMKGSCAPTKIFKSTDVTTTNTWIDITPVLIGNPLIANVFATTEISGMVVNPNNAQEIWISFAKISGDGFRRVVRSLDGGVTWGDYSDNLPGIPINDIEFYKGSNRGIFVATDIGIYYTDDDNYNTSGWICVSNNLPVCLINDIEMNYSLNKIVIGTFGRGIYESSLHSVLPYTMNTQDPFICSQDLIIMNDVTLNNYISCGDIIVKPGGKLTVTGKLLMNPEKEIIVENSTTTGVSGGRMILDGGHITSGTGCDEDGFWRGIFVMGDPTKSQAPFASTQQGYLQIINGGKISNAEVGVALGRLFQFSIIGQGGIVRTNNAIFANNKRDVILWPYQNFANSTSLPIANYCRFHNTQFLQDNLIAPFDVPTNFEVFHVTLLGVDGVNFTQCNFENGTTGNFITTYNNHKVKGIGIYSINSSFRLNGFCDFYEDPDILNCGTENSFKGLFYGIKAISSNPLKTVFIDGNSFERNYHGVFLNGVDYSQISRNNFMVKNVKSSVSMNALSNGLPDIPYGLHLNQCNNYKVTENYFDGATHPASVSQFGSPVPNLYGPKVSLQVSLPDGNPEEIYNNIFKGYHSNGTSNPGVGILVQGDVNDTDPNITSGLQILCNDFEGAEVTYTSGTQIEENYTNHIALTQNGKVEPLQGANFDVTSPAGNTFVNVQNKFHDNCDVNSVSYSDAEFNTTNGLINGVTYYHHSNQSTYPVVLAPLTTFPIRVECGSPNIVQSIAPFDYSKSLSCPTALTNPIPNRLRIDINSYLQFMEDELSMIDGGNTLTLLNLIYGNASPGQVKNELMNASPYLSDEVILAFLNDSPPHGHLKEVIIANSPVTNEVKLVLDNLNLPNGIRNQINAAQNGVSEREQLEARVNWFELKKEQNINDLVRYHLQRDTVPDYLDSLKQVFTEFEMDHNACKLASTFASQKDYIQALALLDAHLAEHPDDALCKLQKLMIEFDQQLSWCLNPTQPQKDKLDEIKDEHHKGCIAAKGFIELIEGLTLEDIRILPNDTRSRSIIDDDKQILNENQLVQIYPNPTTNWITVNINSDTTEIYLVSVFDMTGKCIINETMNKNTFDFDLGKFKTGIYFMKINTDSEIIHIGKIMKE